MWATHIGENAGKIWQTLNQKGQLNLSTLKTASKLDDKKLFLALGWLAREGKIRFEQKNRQIVISLTSD